MKVLVINSGSSSLKYQVIDMTDESVLCSGNVENVGAGAAADFSRLTHKVPCEGGETKHVREITPKLPSHDDAITLVINTLTDSEIGVIASLQEISAVGHRVVHGGEKFSASCLINDESIAGIEENIPLGPLHNPANLMGIRACQQALPGVPQVGVFDTAFHMTMPAKAYRYAIPKEFYTDLHIRKYGFHGTSHRYIASRAPELMDLPEDSKIIICHLGNGSSLSAVRGGKCVDTTMGMTPLDGLVMGTRSGALDPAVVEFICERKGLTAAECVSLLNKKGGLLGICGQSDMRAVTAAAEAGDEDAILALDMWTYRVKQYIGSYAASMGGVDAIIFTAGIGENQIGARTAICSGLEFLGVKVDEKRNNTRGEEKRISADDSRVQVWVIPTNEELAIARDTLALVKNA